MSHQFDKELADKLRKFYCKFDALIENYIDVYNGLIKEGNAIQANHVMKIIEDYQKRKKRFLIYAQNLDDGEIDGTA